jgi:hypothetical protein
MVISGRAGWLETSGFDGLTIPEMAGGGNRQAVGKIILKKAIGTWKNRKKHDNYGVTSKAEATIWVKPIK